MATPAAVGTPNKDVLGQVSELMVARVDRTIRSRWEIGQAGLGLRLVEVVSSKTFDGTETCRRR